MTSDPHQPANQLRLPLLHLVIGVHLAALVVAMEVRRPENHWVGWTIAISSLYSAQVSLAALWVGFGRATMVVYRWGVLAAVIAAWVYLLHSSESDDRRQLGFFVWQGASIVLCAQVAKSLGARLVYAPNDSTNTTALSDHMDPGLGDSPRFSLSELFAVAASVACIAIATTLKSDHVTFRSLWGDFLLNGPYTAIGLASAWAVLTHGNWVRSTLAVMFSAALVGVGQLAVMAVDYIDLWSWYLIRGAGNATLTLFICLSLTAFRALGYRIVGPEDHETPSADERETD